MPEPPEPGAEQHQPPPPPPLPVLAKPDVAFIHVYCGTPVAGLDPE